MLLRLGKVIPYRRLSSSVWRTHLRTFRGLEVDQGGCEMRKGEKQAVPRQMVPKQYAPLWAAAKGNREVNWGLVGPIREVLDSLGRPPGSRRVTYNLLVRYQRNPTVANLIERGKRANGDPKSELGNFVSGTLATMRDVGLVHPDEVADNRSVIYLPDAVDDAAEYLQQLLEAAESDYRHDRLAGFSRAALKSGQRPLILSRT
jgi:hypothetical protein